MTINTNSIMEEVFPFLCKHSIQRSVISCFIYVFNLVTHTGFEPMLTA